MRPLLLLLTAFCAACESEPTGNPDVGACEDGGAPRRFYVDLDGDGYGSSTDRGLAACIQPADLVDNRADCDDDDPARNPEAAEICNGIDDNCVPEDDLVQGGLTINGVQPDDADLVLSKASGEVEVALCGGNHVLDLGAVTDAVTTLRVRGAHETAKTNLEARLSGSTPIWGFPATTTVVLQDVTIVEALVYRDGRSNFLALVDVQVDTATAVPSSDTLLFEDVAIQGGSLTLHGPMTLRRGLLQGSSAWVFDEVLLEDTVVYDAPEMTVHPNSTLTGLVASRSRVELWSEADRTTTLDRPIIQDGTGFEARGDGAVTVLGGTLVGNTPALSVVDDPSVVLDGTALLRNVTSGPNGAVLDAGGAGALNLFDA